MAQRGQVLKLHGCRSDGKARWAYRYRVGGSFSKRPQVGGFATREEAQRALRRELARLRPGCELTVRELVEECLKIHQAAPSTIEKLRWLLSKATVVFGDRLIAELRSEEICAWRGRLPEGHRFEATQALRQVLNAAVAWDLIDVNPARRGVPNPLRHFPEKLPFESWEQINALAVLMGAGSILPIEARHASWIRDIRFRGGTTPPTTPAPGGFEEGYTKAQILAAVTATGFIVG